MARFPSVGEEFGTYRIVRQLGRGGMGVVFAAEHRGLGRTVALKVLSPELAGQADYRTRFSREATVLARLDSPHVVQVLDHGEHDGCLYIATQYVAGGDLADALRAHGPVPVAQAAEIAEQVAWALGDSHAAGVVHRDVKPSNVLLREVSSELFVYLCDFGIAQDRDPGLTAPGAVAGTFAYLAPERLRGEPATASADLYALGCVLFTSLVGSAPYAGSDVEIGMGHLNAPVPQVAAGSPVAVAVNAVLQRSMAKDPGARYPDARAMRHDLRELARLAQTTPHPPLVPLTPAGGRQPGRTTPTPTPPGPVATPAPLPLPAAPPAASWSPPPQPWTPAPPPRGRRTAMVVVGAVLAVTAVAGGIGLALAVTGSDDEPQAGGSSAVTSGSTSDPTTDPTSEPTTATTAPTTAPTTTPTTVAPPPAPPRPAPKPSYPDVPAATGVRIALGPASLRAPAGWGTIDAGIVKQGVGARDYSDYEGYFSSVFIRRSKPGFRLDSIPLLKIAAQSSVEALDANDPEITLKDSELLPTAWLDGQRAVRIRALYYSPGDDLYLSEETWLAQRGPFLYRVTFQHSRADTLDERRAQIDPMVVSFRWS